MSRLWPSIPSPKPLQGKSIAHSPLMYQYLLASQLTGHEIYAPPQHTHAAFVVQKTKVVNVLSTSCNTLSLSIGNTKKHCSLHGTSLMRLCQLPDYVNHSGKVMSFS